MKTFKIQNKEVETIVTEAQLAKLQTPSKMRIAKCRKKFKINGVLFKLADGRLKITEVKLDAENKIVEESAPVKKVPTKIVKPELTSDIKQEESVIKSEESVIKSEESVTKSEESVTKSEESGKPNLDQEEVTQIGNNVYVNDNTEAQ